jgi:hypothetical protein
MTEQLHPMVPPNILLNNWKTDWFAGREHFDVLLIQAYQAGADAELEACCKWLESEPDPGHVDLLRSCATALRAVRRPKPLSLKEQALQELDKVDMLWCTEEFDQVSQKALETIRKALETLPDD